MSKPSDFTNLKIRQARDLAERALKSGGSGGGGGGGGGSGDVTGPGSSTTNDFASFADTTGKVIKDSGYNAASFDAAGAAAAALVTAEAYTDAHASQHGMPWVEGTDLEIAMTDGAPDDPQVVLDGDNNPIYVSVDIGAGGTVTSVAASVSGTTHLTVAGSPVTTSGTLAFTWDGTWGYANGAAATPSVRWNTNYGFFYDTTNVGVGLTIAGTQIGWFAAGGPVYQLAGGALSLAIASEGTTLIQGSRYTADTGAPNFVSRKARGTIASPAVPVTNDSLGGMIGMAYTGAGFTNAGSATFILTETSTVDTSHIGTRYRISTVPVGGSTLTEIARYENETGLSMFGANPVIDQNRVFRPRIYTVATVPAATASGIIQISDNGGSTGLAYTDGTDWRAVSEEGQVISATAGASGLLRRMTSTVSYVNRDVVRRTFAKLSASGVLAKLLGLWVFAGAPSSQADALRNWITLGTRDLAIVGSPTWSQTGGFTGDGSTALLNTGATAAAFGASQNSITIGAYVMAASAASAAVIGQNSSALSRGIYMGSFTSGALTTRLMDATNDTFTPTRYTGMFTMSRTVSTGYNDSLDDLAATAVTRTSAALTARIPCFLGTSDTTGNEFSTAQVAWAFIGNGLTATDVANLRAAMVDYYMVQTGVLSGTYTVAKLPGATASYEGQRLMVSDASVTASGNFGATLTGGGANHVPCYYESGTPAWRIG